ncbi:hypothetical protein R6Q59_005822 [Mikania micrantha]
MRMIPEVKANLAQIHKRMKDKQDMENIKRRKIIKVVLGKNIVISKLKSVGKKCASKSTDFEENADPEHIRDYLDTGRMLISTQKGIINIDVNTIHNLLGLPMYSIPISSLKKPIVYADSYLLWRGRYGRQSKPTNIVRNINDDHLNFKIDYLILFLTTMISCWRNVLCKYGVVGRLDLQVDIKEYDWCGYVVESIRDSKIGWRRCTKTPLERIEIKEGGFGLREILGHVNSKSDDEGEGEAETNNFDKSTIKGQISMFSSIYDRIKQVKQNLKTPLENVWNEETHKKDTDFGRRKGYSVKLNGSNAGVDKPSGDKDLGKTLP